MQLEIKAFNVIFEDWGEEIDDFYLDCQVDIGFKDELGAEIYSLDVISPKRLGKLIIGSNIEIGKGYFITSDYNQNTICKTIKNLINIDNKYDKKNSIFEDISVYFKKRN